MEIEKGKWYKCTNRVNLALFDDDAVLDEIKVGTMMYGRRQGVLADEMGVLYKCYGAYAMNFVECERPTWFTSEIEQAMGEDWDRCCESGDAVDHPSHYNKGGIECFDVIEQFYGRDVLESFCLGNSLKYLMRCKLKGNYEQDLRKAAFYVNKIIEMQNPKQEQR